MATPILQEPILWSQEAALAAAAATNPHQIRILLVTTTKATIQPITPPRRAAQDPLPIAKGNPILAKKAVQVSLPKGLQWHQILVSPPLNPPLPGN